MSEQFPIDPQSLSYSAIKKDLTDWLQTLPDSEQWTLFFESSTGQQIVELISAMYAMTKFDNIVARREAYIQFSKNRSSKLGSAQSLGYSAFRGRNSVIEVTITPNSTGVWEKYAIIGTVKEKDLVVLNSTVYNSGVPVTLECIVGEVKDQSLVCNTESLNAFRFTEGLVSEDVRIFIDNNELNYSTEVKDMLQGSFQIQSNSFNSVDAKYLNLTSFTIRYGVGSIIKLEWIPLYDLDFLLTDVKLDETEGTLTGASLISLYQDMETNDSITMNAPLKNETKLNVRGKKDQAKVLGQIDNKIVSSEGETIANGIMALYYVLDDDNRYTPQKKMDIVNDFDPYRPHGLMPPILLDGHRAIRDLKFKIVREPNTSGDILAKIEELKSELEYKLKGVINVYDLESSLENTSYIKIARVSFDRTAWESQHPYAIGDIVRSVPDNGYGYEVTKHLYRTGNTEPTWPTNVGHTVVDGSIKWEAFVKSDVSEVLPWTANSQQGLYWRVKPLVDNGFAYRAVTMIDKSGATEPTWATTLNGEVVDNNLRWKAIEYVSGYGVWQSDTVYEGGSIISENGNTDFVFQVYEIVKNSNTNIPTFPTMVGVTVESDNLVWKCVDLTEVEHELKEYQYYVINTNTEVS